MTDPGRLLARVHRATQMREAPGVVRDDAVDAGRIDIRELALEHPVRDLRVFEAERTAESAAHRRLRHLDQLDAGDLAEQRARILMDAEDVRRLTRVVVGSA